MSLKFLFRVLVENKGAKGELIKSWCNQILSRGLNCLEFGGAALFLGVLLKPVTRIYSGFLKFRPAVPRLVCMCESPRRKILMARFHSRLFKSEKLEAELLWATHVIPVQYSHSSIVENGKSRPVSSVGVVFCFPGESGNIHRHWDCCNSGHSHWLLIKWFFFLCQSRKIHERFPPFLSVNVMY